MQTVWAALPEFNPHRAKHIPTPMGRPRHLWARIFPFKDLPLVLEFSSVADRPALIGSPSPNLASVRTSCKIRVRFGIGHLGHSPGDGYLSLQFRPITNQCRVWVDRQFPPLPAVVVGEENKSTVIDSFP